MTEPTVGAAWVQRLLLPLLAARGIAKPLDCLKIEPTGDADAEDEQRALIDAGHQCELVFADESLAIPLPDASCDLVLNGRFGAMTRVPDNRARFTAELARVLRPGGALLLGIGNRLCPLDLSGNARRLHGPSEPALLSLAEAERTFCDAGGFSRVEPVSVTGNFGWNKVQGLERVVARALEASWRHVVTPGRRWLYASPANPYLLLWITR